MPAWTDMKGLNGVEWYNVIIIILAVIGVFVNTCSLVVLIKKRKNSMFYKLLKVTMCILSEDIIASNSFAFTASCNFRFCRCHRWSFALWAPGSLAFLQLTRIPLHSSLCLAQGANRHDDFHLYDNPHEF